jgi:predicted O-linked N-acetylglucosamine transferase (SPINDLY family)
MLGNLLRHLLRRNAPRAPEPAAIQAPARAQAGDDWLSEVMRLRQDGRNREIATLCRAVLARQPDDVDALNFLAAALLAQGVSPEGIACLRRIIQLAPHSADTHANLAYVLAATGDPHGAIENYRHAVRLRADDSNVWNNFATLLKALARYDEAESCCRAGLQADAGHAALHRTLAGVLFEQGRVDAAIVEIRAALALDPDVPAAHSELLRMLNYTDAQDPVAVFREHRAWAERHARPLESEALPHTNDPDPARRLRIGYVSPYLHRHAVTFFLESVIQHHDRENLEIFLYADVEQPDDYSQRLREYGARWHKTMGLSDAQLAQRIRDDAIDILVDLSGHTNHNRLLTFARRPAPIQVNWLGFPSTTGMASMDYRITDAWCDPPGTTEHLNSEQLVRLPGIYMAWCPPEHMPDVGPLPALESGCVTFGSFHSCFKITPTIAALWSRILGQVPGSRLALLAISSEAARQHTRELFAGQGIAPERLDFLPRLAFDEYLAAFRTVDIALDTFPYHGATTTCFALWMGLPVVVLAGATHASRADVSMLSNVGLPQLVARSGDEYVEIATRLAATLHDLAALRASLRGMMMRSPITDGRSCARHLESAFREMWVKWCRERGK